MTPTQVKLPKGTKDWIGTDVKLRESIFQSVTGVFRRHGAVALDTPVFELKDVLSGKYGEDSRLIYDLQDQGGELCSLRYDLTVPFARWLAMNTDKTQIKRYQIAKVYRRDQPAINKGRFREFYQCDFDIAGTYDSMIPDAEVLCVVVDTFKALDLDISIKINHREILDGIFGVSGVPQDKLRSISSAVDKLDKMSWEDVKKEMVQKGLAADVADKIGSLVRRSGSVTEILEYLDTNATLTVNEDIQSGIADMRLLSSYLDAFDISSKVAFDLSLARGLDYYTGLIFEVTTSGRTFTSNQDPSDDGPISNATMPPVGSIAAGGRYDNLVGMYGRKQIPCVGISFGVDRIFTVLKARAGENWDSSLFNRSVEVYVASVGGGMLVERMSVTRQLWNAGISAEFMPKATPTMRRQREAFRDVPIVVWVGPEEWASGCVRLKSGAVEEIGDAQPPQNRENEDERRGRLISVETLLGTVKELLC